MKAIADSSRFEILTICSYLTDCYLGLPLPAIVTTDQFKEWSSIPVTDPEAPKTDDYLGACSVMSLLGTLILIVELLSDQKSYNPDEQALYDEARKIAKSLKAAYVRLQ